MNQAIGRSRGGRTTRIHALTDEYCRPIAFCLTGGNVADCIAGEALLTSIPIDSMILHGDKGYDSDRFRQLISDHALAPNIPPKSNRKFKPSFFISLYKNRNAVEQGFCRLKDFRLIATRYDRLAKNFLAAVQITAIVCYWV